MRQFYLPEERMKFCMSSSHCVCLDVELISTSKMIQFFIKLISGCYLNTTEILFFPGFTE